MIEWLSSEVNSVGALIQAAISVLAIAFVGMVFWRSKAFAPTIGALLLAGAVVWGVRNVGWFERQIDKETVKAGAPAAPTLVVEPSGA